MFKSCRVSRRALWMFKTFWIITGCWSTRSIRTMIPINLKTCNLKASLLHWKHHSSGLQRYQIVKLQFGPVLVSLCTHLCLCTLICKWIFVFLIARHPWDFVHISDIKKKLFKDLDGIAKSSAILASNTSSISITRLASATQRPCQVTRLFFFVFTYIYLYKSVSIYILLVISCLGSVCDSVESKNVQVRRKLCLQIKHHLL